MEVLAMVSVVRTGVVSMLLSISKIKNLISCGGFVFKFAVAVGAWLGVGVSESPPITTWGVSLAEFQGGGKCLIEGWSDV